MADSVSAAAIKDFLAECPICTEHFDETLRIPRRMPCCVQSICQPCLETYSRGRQTLSCPLCRHEHHLPGGVKSLPKEPLILKILDHLKIQQGGHLPCTNCSGKNQAVAKCENCCGFICQECLDAHKKFQSLKDHRISTFEEMKGRPVESFSIMHQCVEHKQPQQFYCYTCNKVICVSCTVVDHDKGTGHKVVKIEEAHRERTNFTNNLLIKLDEKIKTLNNSLSSPKYSLENIERSKQVAEAEINKTIDILMEELQQRRAVLLSKVEHKYNTNVKGIEQARESTTTLITKTKSSVTYLKEMRSKADKTEDLQLMASSQVSLNNILKETPQDVKSDRIKVSFNQAHIKHLASDIKTVGAYTDTDHVDFTNTGQGGPSRLKSIYIFLYNLFQLTGYYNIASLLLFSYGPVNMTYGINAVWPRLFLNQWVACLEVIHSLFGIVKSRVSTPLARVAGRNFIMALVPLLSIPSSSLLIPLIWCLILVCGTAEVIRYLYYILGSLGLVVKPVMWLRYSAWIILCPIELLLEGAIVIMSAYQFANSREYHTSGFNHRLTEFLHVYPFLLAFAGYKMMNYMHKKRKEKLDVTGQDDKKTLYLTIPFIAT